MKEIPYRRYSDVLMCIKKNIGLIANEFDLIVGIPRSGVIPAFMIAFLLNLPASTLQEFIDGFSPYSGERKLNVKNSDEKTRVLIVDDSIFAGHSLKRTKHLINMSLSLENIDVKYLAIYGSLQSAALVDYCLEIVPSPRIFEWNYLNHPIASKSCYDIDGVLCVDPTKEENDDGEKYEEFILNAKPLHIPKYEIHSLVTSRLEKYRGLTEIWLEKNGVKYKNLYMLDLPSKAERIRLRAHGAYKSKIFTELMDTDLFVESDRKQAIEIARKSQKPCICVETDELFQGQEVIPETIHISKEPKRILMYTVELSYTGAPHSALRMSKMLRKNGYEVIIWSRIKGPFIEEVKKEGFEIKIVGTNELSKKNIQEEIEKFDLAITNTVYSDSFYNTAYKLIPTIWYIREAQNLKDIFKKFPERERRLKLADEVYCVSEYARNYINKNYNKNVRVVRNSVADYYDESLNRFLIDGKVNFFSMSTIQDRKGIDVMLKAFSSMPIEYQEKGHLYFAGEMKSLWKEYNEEILEMADRNENVTYIGQIVNSDMKWMLSRKMDVFVVPSRDESCSLVALEGAMLAKPLIVTKNVGAKYVVNSESGWVVDTGNMASLKNAFMDAIDKKDLLRDMGEISRRSYLHTSTFEKNEQDILEMVTSFYKRNYLDYKNHPQVNELRKEIDTLNKRLIKERDKNLNMERAIKKFEISESLKVGRFILIIPRWIKKYIIKRLKKNKIKKKK